MIQRFIELGEGYTDIYELIEIGKSNRHRVARLLSFHTLINEKELTSPVIVLEPTSPGDFQPLYICREGIPNPRVTPNKRSELFEQLARELDKPIIELDVKPSVSFKEKQLYYQYLIGILRVNRYLAPLK
ncbi:methylthioribose kinase [Bacillus sp. CECT 9360]|uniref:DUF7147 family protein n=1 Tax=Bacillus sp. CECT 9360 TaxID=2845821 RepID=UPI001E33CF7D|nr:methylthioribose kinase [Bacillus sp. CECT 9360]CAH0345971.1 hypothetical protein BCI9360_02280 [Bacillus sp. CECT 9360]